MKKPTLYHALKMENLHLALTLNALRGYSTHRIHDNGTVPWCANPRYPSKEYLESKWYFGICLTRERSFAQMWNDVVIEFDRDALKARNKIVPYNWMETKLKAEAEEFVVTGYAGFNCGQALIAVDPENETIRENVRFLVDDDSYVGEIDKLNLMIKSISLQLGERPGQLGTLTEKVKQEMLEWRQKRYEKVRKDIEAYCSQYNIPLEIRVD